jgi:hypothetical protein
MLTENALMLIVTLFLTWGIGWAFSILTRKASLVELLALVTFWAVGLASVRWVPLLLQL